MCRRGTICRCAVAAGLRSRNTTSRSVCRGKDLSKVAFLQGTSHCEGSQVFR